MIEVKKTEQTKKYIIIAFSTILAIYLLSVFSINLFAPASFYDTDMYTDMNYSAEVWEHKSIFPDGWVFGNQLYVVATPVLASIFYGITQNHIISMGLASCLYTLLVLLSFDWMLKPVLKKLHERLIALTTLLSIVLFCGDTFSKVNGWQILFTMCSYYACYALTAFIVFGCYLRSKHRFNLCSKIIFVIACVLSFSTGVQSIRQTAVMVVPLLAIEFFRMITAKIHKQKLFPRPMYIALAFSICNIAGVLSSKIINVDQTKIFGEISFISLSDLVSSIISSAWNIIDLFSIANTAINILVSLLVWGLIIFAALKLRSDSAEGRNIYLLFVFSIFSIVIVDIFTTMKVRNIYYFMLFPMIAILFAFLFSRLKRYCKIAILTLLSSVFLFNVAFKLYPTAREISNQNASYQEISEYLQENGYTTVYSGWNVGEKIAIASDFEIQAGFWLSTGPLSDNVDYLCNPEIFNAEANQCAYIFCGQKSADEAIEIAQKQGYDFNLIKYFDSTDIYIFVSDDPIMQPSLTKK